jgi:hypothetical protein
MIHRQVQESIAVFDIVNETTILDQFSCLHACPNVLFRVYAKSLDNEAPQRKSRKIVEDHVQLGVMWKSDSFESP